MRLFIFLILLFFLGSCTTVEVTKEIIKAGNTVKSSISEIVTDKDDSKEMEEIDQENKEATRIEKEKEIIIIQQTEEKSILETQKKIVHTNFLGKTINQINDILGSPVLSRKDGNSHLIRYDSFSCRLFLFYKNVEIGKRVQHFEFRDIHGSLIKSKQSMEKCYKEFKLID